MLTIKRKSSSYINFWQQILKPVNWLEFILQVKGRRRKRHIVFSGIFIFLYRTIYFLSYIFFLIACYIAISILSILYVFHRTRSYFMVT